MERMSINYDSEPKNFLIESLSLVPSVGESEEQIFIRENKYSAESPIDISDPETLFGYFEGVDKVAPDAVVREDGDTTIFTTAGVQKVETLIKKKEPLVGKAFSSPQAVIRSQFMDKVREGWSTSFINFSVICIDASLEDFDKKTKETISLVESQCSDLQKITFNLDDVDIKWGLREFKQTCLAINVDDIQVGECIYIHNFPISEDERVPIIDVGFGIERLKWATKTDTPYMIGFEDVYSEFQEIDRDIISGIIDPIKSMVLIAGEGVMPSNKNHGYRLRQFSKRFVERNIALNISDIQLIKQSLEFWQKWDFDPKVSLEEIINIITIENQRNFNALFLHKINDLYKTNLNIEINQTTDMFLKQLEFSVPLDKIKNIIDLLRK